MLWTLVMMSFPFLEWNINQIEFRTKKKKRKKEELSPGAQTYRENEIYILSR